MIDGKADAREGVFRQQDVENGTSGTSGIEWLGDNTQDLTTGTAAAGRNQDEDQIVILTAHYKMNQ